VLALLVQGLNNTAIAARLVVSPSTAKAHVSSVLTKLGVTNQAEAVALAMRHHLVNWPLCLSPTWPIQKSLT
jgi:DNA-binding NarL/FixJ family response regulator